MVHPSGAAYLEDLHLLVEELAVACLAQPGEGDALHCDKLAL